MTGMPWLKPAEAVEQIRRRWIVVVVRAGSHEEIKQQVCTNARAFRRNYV